MLVKAPQILGTWCMESDTLYVSPAGSDDNKGSDASRPLLTVQHAVNVAADSGTTIRLGPGTFPLDDMIVIPVVADIEPVSLRAVLAPSMLMSWLETPLYAANSEVLSSHASEAAAVLP